MKTGGLFLAALLFSLSFVCGADPIEGVWKMSDGKATMKLTIEKGKLVGRITDVKDKSRTHDTKNPDSKMRGRKIIGLPIVWGFYRKGDKWEGGRVYDSSDGKTYKGKIWMEGKDKMIMRGFVGVSLLGKSAQWNRVK
ncbi:MAG: DUF2147 domain-containing protein [Roseibacillus sp.]